MSKYAALFQIQMAEYFTSLAAGIAGGPFDRQDLHSEFPVSSVLRIPFVCLGCYSNEGAHGSRVKSEGNLLVNEAKFTHIGMRITFDG